jgi:hypothetical protein
VLGEEASGGKNVTVIEIGLKQILLVSLVIAFLFLSGILFLEHLKPRLNLRVECFPNKTVVVSGRLTDGFNPVPGRYVAIEVRDRNGVTVWIDVAKTLDDGRFESVFFLSGEAEGRFDVYASTDIISEKTSFTIG